MIQALIRGLGLWVRGFRVQSGICIVLRMKAALGHVRIQAPKERRVQGLGFRVYNDSHHTS